MTVYQLAGLFVLVGALAIVVAVLWVVMDRYPQAHQTVPYARGAVVSALVWAVLGALLVLLP